MIVSIGNKMRPVVILLAVLLGDIINAGASDLQDLLQRIEDIEFREKLYVSTISELTRSNELKDGVIREMSSRINDLEHSIQSLKERTELLEQTAQDSTSTIAEDRDADDNIIHHSLDNRTNTKTASKRERQSNIQNGISPRLLTSSSGHIAFHAVSDKEEYSHIGALQNIVFETVLLNMGGGYHNNQGVFIAPSSGVYVFSSSVVSWKDNHNEFYAQMVKNGVALAMIYAHGDTGRHDQGSVTVTVELQAGDEVWIRSYQYNGADNSLWCRRMCTFTGFML